MVSSNWRSTSAGVALTPRSFASPSIHLADTRNCITCCLTASYWWLPGLGGSGFFFCPGCGCAATTVEPVVEVRLGDRAGVLDVGDVVLGDAARGGEDRGQRDRDRAGEQDQADRAAGRGL